MLKKLLILAILILTVAIPVSVFANSGSPLNLVEKDTTTWQPVVDGASGVLSFNTEGVTFDYTFTASGLEPNTNYSLIYYADPESGNHPGALIDTITSDGSGAITQSNSINLNMDLPSDPDSNMLVPHNVPPDNYANPFGAKVWLVPSECYDANSKSVISWQFSRFLLETNLINYDDTDSPVTTVTAGMIVNVTEPVAEIAFTVTPDPISFGSVAINECSAVQTVTITNTGTVPITVTGYPPAGFYTNSLKLDGSLVPAGGWQTSKILVSNFYNYAATVCPVAGMTGTLTGDLTFYAEFAP